jgi:hypothetical protein
MEENQQNNDVANMPNIANQLRNIVKNTTQEVEPEPTQETNTPQVESAPVVEEQPVAESRSQPESDPETGSGNDGDYDSWMEINNSETVQSKESSKEPSTEEKLKILDGLMQDREIQLLMEAKRAGKSLLDLTQEYQPIDYGKMDVEDLAKHYGTHLGLNEEQIEESIDGLASMTPIQRHELTSTWRDKLNMIQDGKIQKLVGDYKQTYTTQEQIVTKLFNDVDKEAEFMQNKDLFGAKISNKDADGFKEWVRAFKFDPINPDGTYNAAKLRNLYIAEVLMPQIQKANYAKGQSEGRKEVLKEVHRPSENNAAVTRLPEVKSNQSDADKAQKALKAIMSGKF